MLEDAKAKHRLDSLRLLPLQPIARFPEVLAAGDVLVAVIEADAGTYSVPSKVQSYLCAGRSILLAAPSENLAARVVARENAGIVVAPDGSDFMAAAIRLRHDNELRAQQGANGRAYAERAFDMIKIVDAFEETLCAAIPSKSFNSVRRAERRQHIRFAVQPSRALVIEHSHLSNGESLDQRRPNDDENEAGNVRLYAARAALLVRTLLSA